MCIYVYVGIYKYTGVNLVHESLLLLWEEIPSVRLEKKIKIVGINMCITFF